MGHLLRHGAIGPGSLGRGRGRGRGLRGREGAQAGAAGREQRGLRRGQRHVGAVGRCQARVRRHGCAMKRTGRQDIHMPAPGRAARRGARAPRPSALASAARRLPIAIGCWTCTGEGGALRKQSARPQPKSRLRAPCERTADFKRSAAVVRGQPRCVVHRNVHARAVSHGAPAGAVAPRSACGGPQLTSQLAEPCAGRCSVRRVFRLPRSCRRLSASDVLSVSETARPAASTGRPVVPTARAAQIGGERP